MLNICESIIYFIYSICYISIHIIKNLFQLIYYINYNFYKFLIFINETDLLINIKNLLKNKTIELTNDNIYIIIINVLLLFISYLLFFRNNFTIKKHKPINTDPPLTIQPMINSKNNYVGIIVDLTNDNNNNYIDNNSDNENDSDYIDGESNSDSDSDSDSDSNNSNKNKLITDDESNKLLFDSCIYIWLEYGNEKWYNESNKNDIKNIISKQLPNNLKVINNLFIKYKGQNINTVDNDIKPDLLIARKSRLFIYNLINEIYIKLIDSYYNATYNIVNNL